jgi:hypothetical protein
MKHTIILFFCFILILIKVEAQTFINKSSLYFNQYDNKYYNNGNPFTGFVLYKTQYNNDTIEFRDGIENGIISLNSDNYKLRYFSKNGCLQDGFAIIGEHRGYFKNNRPVAKLVSYSRKGAEYTEDRRAELGLGVTGGGMGSSSDLDKIREKIEFYKDTVRHEMYYGSGSIYERNIYIIDTLFYNKDNNDIDGSLINKECTDWFFTSGINRFTGFDLEKYIRLNNGYPLRKTIFYDGKKVFSDVTYSKGVLMSSVTYFRNGKIYDSLINLDPPNNKIVSTLYHQEKIKNFYQVHYNVNGKLEFRLKNNYSKETGERYTYYSNGNLQMHSTLDDGNNVAPMEYYSDNGILLMKHYKEGAEYYYIENFPDGKLKIKIKTQYNMYDSRGDIIGLPKK